ncbi:MAG TPA: quinoprotein relay system zinc metallohydrolase 1 [Rhodocyclaceae bacterium]|jgi:uncharacterized sulfatase|nr:quinoprotein relay system zinc metallohydrolase 1 [Rhodocyclaceae bacterium]HMV21005.1 quinoprotein relay system zinc metallohydrolase 1 [Rhodocyclaceae bacterium]HNE42595.1 quinoprotein relay system zinc metallohydrolase 1 [Rhodocyclaceae bacterium]HNM81290.1 quinoprotein relay system zinc metallohydrolase 1 [Rhodocyclaceae bacterium]
MRRLFILLGLFLVAVPGGGVDFDYGLEAQRIADGVYVFIGRKEDFSTGNGGNIVNTGFIVGSGGVVVVDTGPSQRYGKQMRKAIGILTGQPVSLVLNTHHHPDHFLGNQAFADRPVGALAGTRAGIERDGNAFAENLFRMAGDWMLGTEVHAPTVEVSEGVREVGGRRLRFLALEGHTGADLAIYDERSGVLFAGDLVFNGRAPTTPHAELGHWHRALDRLEAITREPGFRALVPGHGEVARDAAPIRQTRDYLDWLEGAMRTAAANGMDMNEVLVQPIPREFAGLAVVSSEYRRSVGHLFPAAEQRVLGHGGSH